MPRDDARRIFRAISSLADNPYRRGGEKLSGYDNRWRLRVGNYRIIYAIDNAAQIVFVDEVRRRGTDTYENLP